MTITKAQLRAAAATAVERTEPKFIQFGEGEVVDGVLLKIEPNIEIREKGKDGKETGRVSRATRYTMENTEGELVCFLGTYQIDTRLHRGDIGKYVSIRYEGTDPSVNRNGNPMKLFRVFTAEIPGAETNAHGLAVTDNDIPF